jgi:hypothetical protein
MSKLVEISAVVLGIGLGAWSGYQLGSTRSAASMAHADMPTLEKREAGFSAGRAGTDPDKLRALIREEMSSVLAQQGWRSPEAPSSGADKGAASSAGEDGSPERVAQRREAQEHIEAMLAQGTWGNEQRLSFQRELIVLGPEERERALQQITTAINTGALLVNTDGPPL